MPIGDHTIIELSRVRNSAVLRTLPLSGSLNRWKQLFQRSLDIYSKVISGSQTKWIPPDI